MVANKAHAMVANKAHAMLANKAHALLANKAGPGGTWRVVVGSGWPDHRSGCWLHRAGGPCAERWTHARNSDRPHP